MFQKKKENKKKKGKEIEEPKCENITHPSVSNTKIKGTVEEDTENLEPLYIMNGK